MVFLGVAIVSSAASPIPLNQNSNMDNVIKLEGSETNTESTLLMCEPSRCDSYMYESADRSSYCPCTGYGGYSVYEECQDYFTKSTAKVLNNEATDYCSGSTLYEAWIDCQVNTPEGILWTTKNCNDYDYYTDWTYYCTSNQVKRTRTYYNYGCSSGACSYVSSTEDEILYSRGHDDYCDKRQDYGCTLCQWGEWDCDADSECYGSLRCLDGAGGLSDGCCNLGEIWKADTLKCCQCTEGACCDGCNYRSSSYVCNSDTGSRRYKCEGNCLDDDILVQKGVQYCSGSSNSCSGSTGWVDISEQSCSSSQYCHGSISWSSSTRTCSNAQCTSGACCDTTCDVYIYKSSSIVCSTSEESGCPWGNDLGSDVGTRTNSQYCTGSSSSCSGTIIHGPWNPFDCYGNLGWCENGGCYEVACSKESDCGTDYWYSLKCQTNDVWGNIVNYTCNSPGTKQSSCSNTDTSKKKQECGNDEDTGNPYCKNGNVYQKYIDRGCSNAACFALADSEKLVKTCLQGCANGKCNDIECFSNSDCGTDGYLGTPFNF